MMKVDQAAMMCSLETRAVFLDNDLVEFCRGLPNRFKLRNGVRKYLLKEVARALLPPSIVCRQKKGFGVPLAKWLCEAPTAFSLKALPGVRGEFVQRAFAEHRAGVANHRLLLWSIIAAQGLNARSSVLGAGKGNRNNSAAPAQTPS